MVTLSGLSPCNVGCCVTTITTVTGSPNTSMLLTLSQSQDFPPCVSPTVEYGSWLRETQFFQNFGCQNHVSTTTQSGTFSIRAGIDTVNGGILVNFWYNVDNSGTAVLFNFFKSIPLPCNLIGTHVMTLANVSCSCSAGWGSGRWGGAPVCSVIISAA